MIITTKMLLELEAAIAPDARAEIRLYAGGCDIRVEYAGGLKAINNNLTNEQLSMVASFGTEKQELTWKRLIDRCIKTRDGGVG